MKKPNIHNTLSLAESLKDVPAGLVTRFAPSPTGYLHMGHLVHLLYLCAVAQHRHATVLLRLEDHDRQRCRPAYIEAIFADLSWLGFDRFFADSWPACPSQAVLQSQRHKQYEEIITSLDNDKLVYRCLCSRADLQRRLSPLSNNEIAYDGFCRTKDYSSDVQHCLRLYVEDKEIDFSDILQGLCSQNPARQCGDYPIKDREGNYSYNFACAVDDAMQGVNLIVRGVDIFHCTGRQEHLKAIIRGNTTTYYLHHPLVNDSDGAKLGKSRQSKSLQSYCNEGFTPQQLFAQALQALGYTGIGAELSLHAALEMILAQKKV